jgi:ankyrin repeat protein
MHLAFGGGHADVVALLIDKGSDVDDKGFPFDRMLRHAVYHQQPKLVDVIVGKRGEAAWPVLLADAVKADEPLVLESLVRLGVDVPKALPQPPIHWAMAHGHPDLALMFIDGGADVRAVYDVGTPLGRAAERGYDRVVERLLAKGVDVDAGTTVGTTPLQFAVESRHVGCVKLLLDHGADGKRIDPAARVALERSDVADDKAIAELLRRHEAAK